MKNHRRQQEAHEAKIRERKERREKFMRDHQKRVEFINSKTFMIILLFISCCIFYCIISMLPDGLGRRDKDITESIIFDYPDAPPEFYQQLQN